MKIIATSYLTILFCFAGLLAPAQPIFVSASGTTGQEDGSSWEDAFVDLQDALAIAQSGDSIWIAKGYYYPSDNGDRYVFFELPSGVRLFGGFDGTEQNLSERNISVNPTVLSGKISTVWPEYSILIMKVTNPEDGTQLDGLIFEDSWHWEWEEPTCLSSPYPFCPDGNLAVEVSDTSSMTGLYINNCKFRNSLAHEGGGATIYSKSPNFSLFIENCSFDHNSSKGSGGGIYFRGGGIIQMKNVLVEYNSALNHAGLYIDDGQGALNNALMVSIDSCYFRNNYCEFLISGGATCWLQQSGSELSITNCLFEENFTAEDGPNGHGGGLNIAKPDYIPGILKNCTFKGNKAGTGGGLVAVASNLLVENCLFESNQALFQGGAAYLVSSSILSDSFPNIHFINCVFHKNSSQDQGGVLAISDSRTSLSNCIFWEYEAWGLEESALGFGHNTVLEFNHCLFENPSFGELPIFLNGNNFSKSDTACIFDEDPQFVAPLFGDFRLNYCSPAIDRGDTAIINSIGLSTDFWGGPRIANGIPDIGIHENLDFIPILEADSISCTGQNDGEITAHPNGGVPPYSFEWNNGVLDSIASDLSTGMFWVTITDGNICKRISWIELTASDSLLAEYSLFDASGENIADGAILLDIISGGTPPYSFVWNTGDTTASLPDLLPGNYELTIADHNECTWVNSFTISYPMAIGEFEQMELLNVWPNPGKQEFILTGNVIKPGNTLEVWDSSGRLHHRIILQATESFAFDMANLLPGIYLLVIKDQMQQVLASRMWHRVN